MSILAILGRLILATACSGLIGYERASARRAAGSRTLTLVGVGAAVFSVVSIIEFEDPDESRIAAQIVTGVGFLGAGAIYRDGPSPMASQQQPDSWVVASIGMAAGSGSYGLAIVGTVVTGPSNLSM
jgi:putative Mg2+ transporter-C (MgtC) family protein